MAKLNNNFVASLDIGATKIVCFIAKIDPEGKVNIVGVGHQLSQGIKSGIITDISLLEKAILSAVANAEKMAKINIDKVVVNISTNKQKSSIVNADMNITGHEVSERDLNQLILKAREGYINDNNQVMHCIPISYSIDGTEGVKNPIGMYCKSLSSFLHIITVDSSIIINLNNCLAQCHLNIENYISSAYASSLACLSEDEKELGVILIDFGGGSTSIAMFKDGNLIYSTTIAVGGMHVTKDIAIGLSTNIESAERIKTLHGNINITSKDEQEILDIPQINENGDIYIGHVPKSNLISIIKPRIEETLEMVKDKINQSGFNKISGHIVITGGASQLPGLSRITSEILNRPVRRGATKKIEGMAESTKGPAFSTCAGMLLLAIEQKNSKLSHLKTSNTSSNNFIGKILNWFRENF